MASLDARRARPQLHPPRFQAAFRRDAPSRHDAHCCRLPGDRAIKGEVKLEDARPIAIALQSALVSGWQARTRDAQQLTWRDIAQHNACGRKHLKRFDFHSSDDFASQRAQIGSHRVHNLLRSAARQRPANGVSQRSQHQSCRRASCPVKRQHGVSAHASEHGACCFPFKLAFSETTCRAESFQPKSCQREWMGQQRLQAQRAKKAFSRSAPSEQRRGPSASHTPAHRLRALLLLPQWSVRVGQRCRRRSGCASGTGG